MSSSIPKQAQTSLFPNLHKQQLNLFLPFFFIATSQFRFIISISNRMSCCKDCQQKQTKYRILQCDLQFEIKKMTEDLASQKVSLEIQYQRESKKMAQRYNREKGEREEENRKWLQKYDEVVGDYEGRIQLLEAEYKRREKEIEGAAISKYAKKEQQIKHTYDTNIETLKKFHQATLAQVEQKLQAECLSVRKQFQEEILRLNTVHKQELSSAAREYDSKTKQLKHDIILGLESIDRLKFESHQKQTLLYEQLYQRKQEISGLKYSIDQLQSNRKMLEEDIRLKNLEIEVVKEQHKEEVTKLHQSFQKEKEAIITELSLQIETILKDKLDDCCKFEQVVKNIQVKREHEMKIYQNSLKEVKEFVEERPSREEDIQQIIQLKQMLNLKEKEFQKALSQAKGYRLQLNNKEEIFNKIFCSHSPLNIERIGRRKQSSKMLSRTSSSTLKDMSNKYQSVATVHTLGSGTDLGKKERLVLQPRSSKYF